MTQISKYVTLHEFEHSQTAVRHNQPNHMNAEQATCAIALCRNVVDVIREWYKSPVIVSSGFRSIVVNALVGGAPNSQHTKGQAIDFNIQGKTPKQVFEDIMVGKILGLEYDQLIYEQTWVHISFVEGHNRKERLIAKFTPKGIVYTPV